MSSIAEQIKENQHLIILRALAATNDGRLNETLIARELDLFGHRLSQEAVRTLLRSLQDRAAITIDMAADVIMIAELTQRGQDHVERRGCPITGIALPSRK